MTKIVWEQLNYKQQRPATSLPIMTVGSVGVEEVDTLTMAFSELMRFMLVFELYLEKVDNNYAQLRVEYGDDGDGSEFAEAKHDCDQFIAKFDERFAKRVRPFLGNGSVEYTFSINSYNKIVQFPVVADEIKYAAVEIVKRTAVYKLIIRK